MLGDSLVVITDLAHDRIDDVMREEGLKLLVYDAFTWLMTVLMTSCGKKGAVSMSSLPCKRERV